MTKRQKLESPECPEDEVYIMECIKGYKKVRGVDHYLVKWEGYSDKESTWEPESNILAPNAAIKAQMEKYRTRKPAKRRKTEEPKSSEEPKSGEESKSAEVLATASSSDPSFVPPESSSSSQEEANKSRVRVVRLFKSRRADPREKIEVAAKAGVPPQALSVMVEVNITDVGKARSKSRTEVLSLLDVADKYPRPLVHYFLQKIHWLTDANPEPAVPTQTDPDDADLAEACVPNEADKENIPPCTKQPYVLDR